MQNLYAIHAQAKRLPANADGHIVSPRYTPSESPYHEKWDAYCATTPKENWPQFLIDDFLIMRGPK